MSDKTLTKIAALLRKAESTDNEHEADAYLAAAQRIATVASIDLAVARAATVDQERRKMPRQERVLLGEAGKRGLKTYVELFLAIAHANDVTCDIARNSTSVVAYGFDTDIDTTKALYQSLVVQMVKASDQYIKSPEFANEQVTSWSDKSYAYVTRPVPVVTARISFQRSYAYRIQARLAAARKEALAEMNAANLRLDSPDYPGNNSSATSTEVAIRAKELEVQSFYKETSNARGSWNGSSKSSRHSAAAGRAGDSAARRARLGSEGELGGCRPEIAA